MLKLPLDESLDPTDAPTLLVNVPTQWHDTVEVDACGNLYVAGLFPPQLHPIGSDLAAPILASWEVEDHAHGFQWGEPPWDEEAVYLSLPDQAHAVDQWVLGVPGRLWPGEVTGGTTL